MIISITKLGENLNKFSENLKKNKTKCRNFESNDAEEILLKFWEEFQNILM